MIGQGALPLYGVGLLPITNPVTNTKSSAPQPERP